MLAARSVVWVRAVVLDGTRVGFLGVQRLIDRYAARLRGRRGDFYGISALYRKDPRPFREDMPKIFELLRNKKIDPVIKYTFPLLEARKAIELLISGSATGKIVLIKGVDG